jgi:hypothetical protein
MMDRILQLYPTGELRTNDAPRPRGRRDEAGPLRNLTENSLFPSALSVDGFRNLTDIEIVLFRTTDVIPQHPHLFFSLTFSLLL